MSRRRAVASAVLVTVSACVAAWVLAYPDSTLIPAMARAVADGAAVITLGLAALPALDTGRHREELIRHSAAPLVTASAVWLAAEVGRLVLAGAEAAGTVITRLGLRTAVEFTLHTAPGRAGAISVIAAAAVCALAVAAPGSGTARVITAGLTGTGILGRAVTGHLSVSAWGGAAIAVHALAAALWCGVLAGSALTVEHRGQWARILPRFSQLSVLCVAVLLSAGVLGTLTVIKSPFDLYATGYGRLLSAKLLLTAVLMAVAWRNRGIWLPAARAHRTTAAASSARAHWELALMAVVLAAAATLAVTG